MNYKSYAVGVSYLSFYLFQDEVVTCINKPPELFLVSSTGLSASWGFFQTSCAAFRGFRGSQND